MTDPSIPQGYPRSVATPAREVSQTGNIGIPAALTDSAGRPVRDPTGAAATISDSGYLPNPGLTPRAEVGGLTPNIGTQASTQVLRQVLTDHTRAFQAELHGALRPHTEAASESARAQRETTQAVRDLTQAVKEQTSSVARGSTTGTPGGTPATGGAAATGSGSSLPSSASRPAPVGAPAAPGFHRLDALEGHALQGGQPASSADLIARQKQQISALEERLGGPLGQVAEQAQSRAMGEGSADQSVGLQQNYYNGLQGLHGMSARFLAPVAHRLQNYQAQAPDLTQDAEGNYRVRGTGRVSLERGAPNTPDRLATGEELESFARGAARTGAIRGAGARIGELGIAGVPGLGEAAIGLGAAHQLTGMYQNQREQARQYQSVEGGSVMGGMAERGRAATFGFSQMGVMSGGQARELFQGVTAAGYRGTERQGALEVATAQFRRNGTDIAQTLQLMTAAAQTGGKSLTGVNAALNDLTDLARRNGQNAAELRQQFVQNYSSRAQVYGSQGGTNAAMAATETAITSGQGERFAGVSAAGLNTDMSARMQANAMHMQIGQFIGRAGNDPAFAARAQSSQVQRAANLAVGGQAGAIQSQLQQLRQAHPDGQIPEEDIQRLSQQLLNSGTFDPGGAAHIESAMGIQGVSDQNAAEMVVRQLSGAADPATTQARQVRDASPRAVAHPDAYGEAARSANNDQSARRGHGWLSGVRNWSSGVVPGAGHTQKTERGSGADEYGRLVQRTGQAHPVIEKLLQSGIGSNNARVKVKTKSGDRDVTLGDAIKNYADQLDTGQNTIVGGPQAGQNISAITGGMGTQGKPEDTGSAANDKLGKHGKKDDPNKGKGDGGTVTISPTPLLTQMFNFSGTGNVAINSGRDTGTPPSANVTPQQMPVGGN